MRSGSMFLPEVASTVAGRVDGLYLFLVGLTAFFTVLIFALFIVFTVAAIALGPSFMASAMRSVGVAAATSARGPCAAPWNFTT